LLRPGQDLEVQFLGLSSREADLGGFALDGSKDLRIVQRTVVVILEGKRELISRPEVSSIRALRRNEGQ
jgi:hypothetical protein